ncbi:right-handed parallel beta-helix repeat-containing protein [Microbacterium sp. XT11]|uniref:right-handed parallel beta-helix repeat-containing protein n=1 Tax=Microbacterium sp. XT11 TaxID=367477 RepID=UPI000A4BBEE5|nr:right-handed parallel beta-helix repeat-containing protein [Microbacterium sp. XT11]
MTSTTPSPASRPSPVRGIFAFLATLFAVAALLTAASRADAAASDSPFLSDTMDRSVASGWGTAPGGGAYTTSSTAIATVADGAATLGAPGAGRTAMVRWNAATATDTSLVTQASVPDELSEKSGVYLSTHVRDTGDRSYAARLRTLGDGRTELSIVVFSGYKATELAGRTVVLGDAVRSGFQVEILAVGSAPVELRARAWAAGEEAPGWQVTATDSSPSRITAAGGLAWSEYASLGGDVAPVHIDGVTASRVAANHAGAQPGTEEQPAGETPDEPGAEAPSDAACDSADAVCDLFTRSQKSAWGEADRGGAWRASASAVLSVDGESGLIASPAAGRVATATLGATLPADTTTTAEVTVPALPRGGSGLYLSLANRIVGDSSYAARLRVQSDGTAELHLLRLTNLATTETVYSAKRLPEKVEAGDSLRVVFQASGTGAVSLSAKAWPVGSTEPAGWTVAATDSTASRISSAGRAGIVLYSARGGDTPAVAIDAFSVRAAEAGAEPAQPGEQPQPPAPAPDGTFPRGDAGAGAPGSSSYAVPATAVHVARGGSDVNDGSAARPLATITAALRKVPSGGTIVVHEGSYHEEVIVPPQKRVTIQPAPGEEVWLPRAQPVSGWRAESGVWVKDGWTLKLDASPTYTKGAADGTSAGWQFVNPEHPMAAHPDQVWVGGAQLKEVASRSLVKAGTFFVDKSRSQLVIGSDPTGKAVEASTLTQAVSIRSAGSVLQGIGVRRYATSVPQMGTVVVAAADVTVSDVTIRDNSTTGLYTWSPRTTFDRVSVIGNGLLGAGASTADGLRVHRMLSVGNNSEQFNRAPVSGALKIGRSRDIEVTDSAFLDNLGQGPWFDESVYDIVFTGNDVVGNTGHGVVFELSEKALIADNVVSHNALNGVYIINTGNAQIWNNTAVGNQRNIAITQDKRRASDTSAAGHDPRQPIPDPTMPWITRNTVLVNNVVGDAGGNCLVCVEDFSKEFTGAQMVSRSDGNLYSRPGPTAPTWFGVWSRGGAGNPAVTNDLDQFVAATGHDANSALVEGRSVVDDEYQVIEEAVPAGVAVRSLAAPSASIAQAVPPAVAAESHLPSGTRVLGAQPR